MKKSHRLELSQIPGFINESGTLKLRIEAANQVGRDYDEIERLAYPPRGSSSQADALGKLAESQNQMLSKLMPMVEGIINDPKDPRSRMMQQMFGMLSGLPAMPDVEAMRSEVSMNGSSIPTPTRDNAIEVQIHADLKSPTDAATWLASNFASLMPGFVEAATYAYSKLAKDPLDKAQAAAYLVDKPTDQDFLNRVRIQAVEIGPERRYVFSFETPCAHLEEHGMYAVFQEDKLITCGEYDVIADDDCDGYDDDDDV